MILEASLGIPDNDTLMVEQHHTFDWVTGSSGKVVRNYIDLRDALICGTCSSIIIGAYREQIAKLRKLHSLSAGLLLHGTFGAMLASALIHRGGTENLWSMMVVLDKKHGRPIIGRVTFNNVILVDDVVTTGQTLHRMKDEVVRQGLREIGTVVWRGND